MTGMTVTVSVAEPVVTVVVTGSGMAVGLKTTVSVEVVPPTGMA